MWLCANSPEKPHFFTIYWLLSRINTTFFHTSCIAHWLYGSQIHTTFLGHLFWWFEGIFWRNSCQNLTVFSHIYSHLSNFFTYFWYCDKFLGGCLTNDLHLEMFGENMWACSEKLWLKPHVFTFWEWLSHISSHKLKIHLTIRQGSEYWSQSNLSCLKI